jgi:hypothetical protein
MSDWLTRDFTILGIVAQNWTVLAVAIILIAGALAWRSQR